MADKNAELDNKLILFASTASQLLAEKKVDEAVNLCETGVREFPFYAPGHYILGLCYDELGKAEDAKNEFERVLVYDPSHNTAMHRLADIYARSGLEQVANELLIKEALYSPLNSEIINILKEKNLYTLLNPPHAVQEEKSEVLDPVQDDVAAVDQIVYENEQQVNSHGEQSILDETDLEPETIFAESQSAAETTEMEIEQELDSEALIQDDEEADFDNLDPLGGAQEREESESDEDLTPEQMKEIAQSFDSKEDINNRNDEEIQRKRNDFMNMDEEDIDENEWLEVENLLIDEEYEELESPELDTYSSILPQSEMLRNDTELLLEELKSADTNSMESASKEQEDEEPVDVEEERHHEEVIDNTIDNAPEIEDVLASSGHDEQSDDGEYFESEEREVTIKDMMENPNLVTPTFGEILIAQHKFSEARHVFLELRKREPQNQRFNKKIDFLNKFLEAQSPA